jgi:protein-tyrosine phosphatase
MADRAVPVSVGCAGNGLGMASAAHDTFRVLFVCTGNICRSPMAEYLLRARAANRGLDWVRTESAGVAARPDLPIQPHALTFLGKNAVSGADTFRSRPLTRELVADADLLLVAERAHRERIASLVETAWPRTFTVLEFSRLLGHVLPAAVETLPAGAPAAERARGLVEAVAAQRSRQARRASDDDVADPMGRRYGAFKESGALLARAADVIADALAACATPASR